MAGADSAPGLDRYPKCDPAPGKASKVRILPVWSSAGPRTRAAHSLDKQNVMEEEEKGAQAGKGCAFYGACL